MSATFRLLLQCALCLTIVLGLAACGSDEGDGETGTGTSGAVITFGAALSLTGKISTEGGTAKDGYDIYVDEINQRGGIEVGGKAQGRDQVLRRPERRRDLGRSCTRS